MKLDAVTEVGLDHLYHKRETKEIEVSVRGERELVERLARARLRGRS